LKKDPEAGTSQGGSGSCATSGRSNRERHRATVVRQVSSLPLLRRREALYRVEGGSRNSCVATPRIREGEIRTEPSRGCASGRILPPQIAERERHPMPAHHSRF